MLNVEIHICKGLEIPQNESIYQKKKNCSRMRQSHSAKKNTTNIAITMTKSKLKIT